MRSCNMNIVSIMEADMWEAIMQSGQLIIGVLLIFGMFMAALLIVERGTKKRRRTPKPALSYAAKSRIRQPKGTKAAAVRAFRAA